MPAEEPQGGRARAGSSGSARQRREAPLETERLTLIDDQGREREFVLHDAFDADGDEYYLVEAADDPDTVLVLKRTEEGLETVEGEELSRIVGLLESEE